MNRYKIKIWTDYNNNVYRIYTVNAKDPPAAKEKAKEKAKGKKCKDCIIEYIKLKKVLDKS